MRVTILYPRFTHPAIEERYGCWQSQLFLRRAHPEAEWITYEIDDAVSAAARQAAGEYCLVVTNPLLLVGGPVALPLAQALAGAAVAAVPVTNESDQDAQLAHGIDAYLTIRQFQDHVEERLHQDAPARELVWSGDPGLYLASTQFLRSSERRAADALTGEITVVSERVYVHRWTKLRSQSREDLLPQIPPSARRILEFGSAEGLLGESVKKRQPCRFTGIEIDTVAAAEARRRLDEVHCGDATSLVRGLSERFDCIVGGDVLEHVADPWSFLMDLKRVAMPGAMLLLSIPNVANWAIVADLLRGRFDYAYIAIACAGHLRFFARNTISDALEIAGWTVVSIDRQPPIVNAEAGALLTRLADAGIPHDPDELMAPGFYVRARNAPAG